MNKLKMNIWHWIPVISIWYIITKMFLSNTFLLKYIETYENPKMYVFANALAVLSWLGFLFLLVHIGLISGIWFIILFLMPKFYLICWMQYKLYKHKDEVRS